MEMEIGVKRAVLIFLKREKAEMALGMFEVLWMWQILSSRSRRPHFRTFWGDVKRWKERRKGRERGEIYSEVNLYIEEVALNRPRWREPYIQTTSSR